MTTTPKPPDNVFYFNNSSIPWTACSRRYVYKVVKGAKNTTAWKQKAFKIGLTFHRFMQLIGTTVDGKVLDLLTLMTNESLWHPDAASLDKSFVHKLAIAADRMYHSNAWLFADCIRERFFEYPVGHVIDKFSAPTPILCGTSDLLSYHAVDRHVYVTDYKTTSHEIDGSHVAKYNLSFQRFFYEQALAWMAEDETNDLLPPHYREAILAGRMKFGYWFYSHKTDQDMLIPHTHVNSDRLKEFAPLLAEKIELARYLHTRPDQSAKEGILLGLCRDCEFSSICGLHNDRLEAEQFAKWAYGFEKYYPKHD